jgi:hypothetical protein
MKAVIAHLAALLIRPTEKRTFGSAISRGPPAEGQLFGERARDSGKAAQCSGAVTLTAAEAATLRRTSAGAVATTMNVDVGTLQSLRKQLPRRGPPMPQTDESLKSSSPTQHQRPWQAHTGRMPRLKPHRHCRSGSVSQPGASGPEAQCAHSTSGRARSNFWLPFTCRAR